MPTYKKGDVWSARDAQFVYDGVEKLLGTYDLNLAAGGAEIKFGKANGDIVPDTITGSIIEWDATQNPPTDTGQQIDDVWYVWLSDEKVSDGKEVIIWRSAATGNRWQVLWAECETPPVNIYLAGAGYPHTVNDGDTFRLPLSLSPASTGVAFNLIGGNTLEAIADVQLNYEMAIDCEYDVSQNGELVIDINIVTVSGSPTTADIPLFDSFQSSRAGVFPRSHNLPKGIIDLTAGDQIAFDAINSPTSSGDLVINALILVWNLR